MEFNAVIRSEQRYEAYLSKRGQVQQVWYACQPQTTAVRPKHSARRRPGRWLVAGLKKSLILRSRIINRKSSERFPIYSAYQVDVCLLLLATQNLAMAGNNTLYNSTASSQMSLAQEIRQ